MQLSPLHADELALHHELRDAFNERLVNTSFLPIVGNPEPVLVGRAAA